MWKPINYDYAEGNGDANEETDYAEKKKDVVEDEYEDIAKEVWKSHKSLFPTIQLIYRQFHDLTLGVIGISTNACACTVCSRQVILKW